jgi:uncharacterized SAM-binding protein YcdF (DUF218 family)
VNARAATRSATPVRLARRRRRWLGMPLAALVLVMALWAAGFVWFAATMPSEVEDPASATDAVVVLTGGRQRIDSGLALLADGKAKKLFISGVNPAVRLSELLHLSPKMPEWVECCIVLGRTADDTVGNAEETAEWMQREGFTSLRLVTAAYHMRRSLLEFRRAMPAAVIVPHPVFPENVKAAWWAWPGTASLVATEYGKYLAALFRASVPLLPEHRQHKEAGCAPGACRPASANGSRA